MRPLKAPRRRGPWTLAFPGTKSVGFASSWGRHSTPSCLRKRATSDLARRSATGERTTSMDPRVRGDDGGFLSWAKPTKVGRHAWRMDFPAHQQDSGLGAASVPAILTPALAVLHPYAGAAGVLVRMRFRRLVRG